MAQDPLPDADLFKEMKRKIRQALVRAVDAVSLWSFYPNVDVTIQVRKGKCARLEWREVEDLTNA